MCLFGFGKNLKQTGVQRSFLGGHLVVRHLGCVPLEYVPRRWPIHWGWKASLNWDNLEKPLQEIEML
jgi:hypothetical protein